MITCFCCCLPGKTVEVLALLFSNPKPYTYRIAEFETGRKLKRSLKNVSDNCPPLKLMRPDVLVKNTNEAICDTSINIKKDVTDTIEYLITKILEQEELELVKPIKTKKLSLANVEHFTNVVTHGDYLLYKDRHSNPTCCCICSLNVGYSERIQCSRCPNIFHLQCSGYGKITLADYDCPHCSMKEVSTSVPYPLILFCLCISLRNSIKDLLT